MAERGYLVDSIDSSDPMAELTRSNAVEAGVGERVTAKRGDAHSLNYRDDTFKVVVALGVSLISTRSIKRCMRWLV